MIKLLKKWLKFASIIMLSDVRAKKINNSIILGSKVNASKNTRLRNIFSFGSKIDIGE